MTKALGAAIRADFPIFKNNPEMVFLDSAASSQKPQVVIDAMSDCYEQYYANVHRGIYGLSERSSEAYEGVRPKVQSFINASSEREIIFTRNATESINLVAYAWGRQHISQGDEIVITIMEHHANLVPWQELAREKGATLHFAKLTDDFRLDLDHFASLLNDRTKLVAFTHMSNVLGTINPVSEMIRMVREHTSAVVLVDGAQSVPHFSVDVQALDADFYVFSSHKMLGPAGVGVLYGKESILQDMPPFITGGDMISRVTTAGAEWNELPHKFEAGTPAIADVIGLGAAIDYLQSLGLDAVAAHEHALTEKALVALAAIPGVSIIGPSDARDRGGAIAFSIADVHPHDLASIFDEEHIAIRAGNHCAQPLHNELGIPATARASFYVYNNEADIEALVRGIAYVKKVFSI